MLPLGSKGLDNTDTTIGLTNGASGLALSCGVHANWPAFRSAWSL